MRERLGHGGSERAQRRRLVGDVLHRDRDRRVALERHAAREHLVEHHAERVDVGLRPDAATARLLGREVLRGADDRADLGHLRVAGVGDAEVGDLDAAVVADEHVVRLDVAVDDAVLVGVAQAGEHLHRDRDRALGRERALLLDDLLERAPLEVLHRDVRAAVGLAAVVDGDDVRVVEARGGLRLAPEALDELAVLGVALGHDLERDLAAEARVLGQVDRRHAADAQAPEHAVAAVERLAALGVLAGHRVILPRLCCATCPREAARSRVYEAAFSTACMTSRAIGAAACAAVLLGALDDHGDGDLRLVGRRERDEPRVQLPVAAGLRRAGLAGDLDARDLRRLAGALVDDVLHHLGHGGRRPLAEGAAERLRCGARSGAPRSGERTRSTSVGRITTPPFANVAATIAICIGVTTRLAWPIAVRAGSIGAFGESSCVRARRTVPEAASCSVG